MLSTIEAPVKASFSPAHVDHVCLPTDLPVAGSSRQKQFHIFGKGISFSISPTIHNAGFAHDSLPYVYDIRESDNINGVADLIQSQDFGGASVTMPHKLQVQKYCDDISDTAKLIGAINTLIVSEKGARRHITGENTDWSGLHALLSSYLRRSGKQLQSGLVIGAGGASRAALYALHRANVRRIYIVNRTRPTAEKVRDSFKGVFDITIVPSLSDMTEKPGVVIGTVPADTTTEGQFQSLFGHEGLCIDMSYKPRVTPLLSVARSRPGWETIAGVEVLLAQGFDQYRLWTGRQPPKSAMIQAVAQKEQDMSILSFETRLR